MPLSAVLKALGRHVYLDSHNFGSSDRLAEGKLIGSYRVQKLMGRGAWAEVRELTSPSFPWWPAEARHPFYSPARVWVS